MLTNIKTLIFFILIYISVFNLFKYAVSLLLFFQIFY